MAALITLRDIARRAGVHLTTVARAIKDDPRVRPETAAKIKALAQKMGYTPDPMLSALNAYRHTRRGSRYRGNVAWVTNFPSRNAWADGAYLHYREGAAETLQRHGYNLENFWLREPGLTAKRASSVLASRGIRGLLICPIPANQGHLSLDWKRFCTMTFGYSLARPQFHLATSSHYQATITCLRRLRALGYQRIGLAIPMHMEERMNRMWTAAYLTHVPAGKLVPPFTFNEIPAASENSQRLFLDWYQAFRPDAIMMNSGGGLTWLREAGIGVPRDVGLAAVNLQEGATHSSGIIEAARDIGRAAGDFLAAMIQRGEYGIPRQPQRILLDGHWHDGPTTRPPSPASSLTEAAAVR